MVLGRCDYIELIPEFVNQKQAKLRALLILYFLTVEFFVRFVGFGAVHVISFEIVLFFLLFCLFY